MRQNKTQSIQILRIIQEFEHFRLFLKEYNIELYNQVIKVQRTSYKNNIRLYINNRRSINQV